MEVQPILINCCWKIDTSLTLRVLAANKCSRYHVGQVRRLGAAPASAFSKHKDQFE